MHGLGRIGAVGKDGRPVDGRLRDGAVCDLLEMLDDRHGHRSTLVTSQIPIENWHALLGGPTLADAILDRLVRNT